MSDYGGRIAAYQEEVLDGVQLYETQMGWYYPNGNDGNGLVNHGEFRIKNQDDHEFWDQGVLDRGPVSGATSSHAFYNGAPISPTDNTRAGDGTLTAGQQYTLQRAKEERAEMGEEFNDYDDQMASYNERKEKLESVRWWASIILSTLGTGLNMFVALRTTIGLTDVGKEPTPFEGLMCAWLGIGIDAGALAYGVSAENGCFEFEEVVPFVQKAGWAFGTELVLDVLLTLLATGNWINKGYPISLRG